MDNNTIVPINYICDFLVPTTRSEQINVFIVFAVNLVLTLSTLIANSMVLYIFIVRLKRYKDVSDLLLTSLAVCDLVAGLFLHPVATHIWFLQSKNIYSCGVEFLYMLVMSFILTNISVTIILFITIDIYWGIVKPYAERWSTKTCFCILATLWILIIVTLLLIGYVFPSYWLALQCVNGTIGLILYIFMIISHWRLNFEVRRMQETTNSSQPDANLIQKMFKLSTSVLFVLGLCYFPFMIYSIARMVKDFPFFVYMRPWCFFATLMNQLFDPIIYCVRLESIHHEVVKLFFCKNRSTVVPSDAA